MMTQIAKTRIERSARARWTLERKRRLSQSNRTRAVTGTKEPDKLSSDGD